MDRVLLCSGKVYYELLEQREQRKRSGVAIVRVEQLYPVPGPQLAAALEAYPEGTPVYWVQEEPANMGAALYLKNCFAEKVTTSYPFEVIARLPSASPATGSARCHREEQDRVISAALAGG